MYEIVSELSALDDDVERWATELDDSLQGSHVVVIRGATEDYYLGKMVED